MEKLKYEKNIGNNLFKENKFADAAK